MIENNEQRVVRERMVEKLSRLSRVERLRAIIRLAEKKEEVTCFDLAVKFGVSPNVIYKDVKQLKDAAMLGEWDLIRKPRLDAMEMLKDV